MNRQRESTCLRCCREKSPIPLQRRWPVCAGPLDESAVSRDMEKADEQVTLAFFKKEKEKLRRPWDGPDLE